MNCHGRGFTDCNRNKQVLSKSLARGSAKLNTSISGFFTFVTRNNITRDLASSLQPASRPRVLRGKDGKPHRNNDERRPWQNQERNADQ